MNIDRIKLFYASCTALLVTSMTFGIRAGMLDPLGQEFGLSGGDLGLVAGTAFWGFTLAMMFGGTLVDVLGMKRLVYVAFVGHLLGIVLTIFASGFWGLFLSTLFIGIANGMVEAALNPLVAALYPDQKTKMLNRFHVWFPGGIVIGGLIVYAMNGAGMGWQLQMATMLLPLIAYGIMFFSLDFPKTERAESNVSYGDMFKSCLKPLYVFMVVLMLMTASTELGTNQWLPTMLEGVGVAPILVLVFINGIMVVGRAFAGPVVHKLNPTGMLLASAIFSGLGLMWLSSAEGMMTFAAAGVFAIGITYFWPTMIGFVAEYLPETGALGMSILGGAGMLSVSLILPFMGEWYDAYGGSTTLRYVAVFPVILTVAFGALYAMRNKLKS